MKKLFLMLAAIGIIISGCSQKAVVKPVEQPEQEIPAAEQRQSEKMPTEKLTPVPAEKVTSSDTADQAFKNSRETLQLQAKLQDIHFAYDKYAVRAEEKPALKIVSDILLKNNNLKVSIEGHCDERGTNEYNLALGDKRANAVKEYLISLGIPPIRIETISYGEEKPVCTESTEACWTRNRRAHFVLEEGKR